MTVMQGLHLGRWRKSGNLRRFIERLCGGVCYNGVIFSLWGPSVETATQEAITVALDKAIAATAEREFQRLIQDRDPIEIAKKICGALRGLEKLQSGEMPEYDEWVALFYLLWYQPERINLAYTLARRILERDKGDTQESRGLVAYDFGCGELAMQFGLALNMADALEAGKPLPALAVTSSDTSQPMLMLGRMLWDKFVREIALRRNPNLGNIHRACNELRFVKASGVGETDSWVRYSTIYNAPSQLESARWITALHVAYKEITDDVMDTLDELASEMNPDCILVTTHPISSAHAYRPTLEFSERTGTIGSERLELKGNFNRATTLRKRIFHEHVESVSDGLSVEDKDFVRTYLVVLPTAWITRPSFKSFCAVYERR